MWLETHENALNRQHPTPNTQHHNSIRCLSGYELQPRRKSAASTTNLQVDLTGKNGFMIIGMQKNHMNVTHHVQPPLVFGTSFWSYFNNDRASLSKRVLAHCFKLAALVQEQVSCITSAKKNRPPARRASQLAHG